MAEFASYANGAYTPNYYTGTPSMDGTGAPGSAAFVARGDHVHPTDTGIAAASASASHNIGRNLCHNPLMAIAQRGAGPFTGTGDGYTLDRWLIGRSVSTMTCLQNVMTDAYRAAIGDEAAVYSLRTTVVGTAGAGDYAIHMHRLEGVRRLSGKTVTLSFWAMAETAGMRLGASFYLIYGNGGSPSPTVVVNGQSVALGAALAWSRYSMTFTLPSSAGATFGTTLGTDVIQLAFWYSSGATNAIISGNVGVQSATFNLWGVQLEIGSVATPLEKPDPRYDLSNCQRFYQVGAGQLYYFASGGGISFGTHIGLPVSMRSTTIATTVTVGANTNGTGLSLAYQSPSGFLYYGASVAAGAVNSNATFTFSADL